MLKVKVDKKELIFLGDSLDQDGPLVETVKDYIHGRQSYAHWFPPDRVMRFGSVIANKMEVLEDLGPRPEMEDDFLVNLTGAWIETKDLTANSE